MDILDKLLAAAKAHGDEHDDPTYEASDLGELLRCAWGLMSVTQRELLAHSDEAREVLEWLPAEGSAA